MATRSNRPDFEDSLLADFQSSPEKAPSVMVKDRQTFPQMLGLLGLFLLAVGGVAMTIAALQLTWRYPVGPGLGFFLLTSGLGMILYHCFSDPEYQFRRMYGGTALMLFLAGFGVAVYGHFKPAPANVPNAFFLPLGYSLIISSLFFVLGVLTHEDEPGWRTVLQRFLAVAGIALFGLGLVGVVERSALHAGSGFLSLVLAIVFFGATLGTEEAESDRGFLVGLGIGIGGAILILTGVITSLVINQFLIPNGFILIFVGLLMVGLSLWACCDFPFIALTRRELTSYFYSPVAYIFLLAMLVIFYINFFGFVDTLRTESDPRRAGTVEPIRLYLYQMVPVFGLMVFIPAITMRLFSEEKRSGSLEVLLTAPVHDSTIVWSKFMAAWIFSLLVWVPAFLFLGALRSFNPVEFDYRPLLSFMVTIMVSHASFVAMGMFFSSLTSNQIVAAILSFTGMVFQLMLGFFSNGTSAFSEVGRHAAFLILWDESLMGNVSPRTLFFHGSLGIFFIFLTTMVLSSRKWK